MNPQYNNGVMSPPVTPSKQSSQCSTQSQSSSGNPFYAAPQPRRAPGVMSPPQAQVALYHDGYQVASPQVMPPSPYPKPTPKNTWIEDPEYQEFLEGKRQKKLAEAEQEAARKQQQQQQQRQQSPMTSQSPPQPQAHFPQSRQQTEEMPWIQPQAQPQPMSPQQYWAMQVQFQQQMAQQAQQQQSQPHRSFTSPPNQSFPLPPHLQQYQQRPNSAFGTMDEMNMHFHQQFAPAPQAQPPHIHAIHPGHTYGKITARGNAKIMMGNGVSGKSTGVERQHNYGEVDIDDNVDIKLGDFGAPEIGTFFHRER